MARNIITGLDIGSSSIRAIVVERKKDGTLHILAYAQKESEGVRRGYIINLDDASKTISATIKSLEKISGLVHQKRHCFRRWHQPRLLSLQSYGPDFQSRRRNHRP